MMNKSKVPDKTMDELVLLTGQNNTEARNALIELLIPKITGTAKHWGSALKVQEREDMVSQISIWTIECLCSVCGGYDPNLGTPGKLLNGMIKNQFHRYYRDSKALKRSKNIPIDTIKQDFTHPGPSPEQQSQNRFLAERCSQFVSQLNPIDQTIIRQRLLLGASSKEVAKILDINPAAVDTKLSRSKKKLRALLDLAEKGALGVGAILALYMLCQLINLFI